MVLYGEGSLNNLAFADDLVLFANSSKELQERLVNLEKRLIPFGLVVNPSSKGHVTILIMWR